MSACVCLNDAQHLFGLATYNSDVFSVTHTAINQNNYLSLHPGTKN